VTAVAPLLDKETGEIVDDSAADQRGRAKKILLANLRSKFKMLPGEAIDLKAEVADAAQADPVFIVFPLHARYTDIPALTDAEMLELCDALPDCMVLVLAGDDVRGHDDVTRPAGLDAVRARGGVVMSEAADAVTEVPAAADSAAVRLAQFEERVNEMARRSPGAVALAEVVSLAARVGPALLRAARLALLPHAEADLWFSPLVRSYSPVGLVLHPPAREVL
jgi:hypothetical protein